MKACRPLAIVGLLRFYFRLLYHPLAFTYDLVSWTVSVGQWREWQRAALPFVRGKRVLEVAHGTGNLQIDLINGGHSPLALDLSPTMGRIAKSKLAKHRLPASFVRGDAAALPFASNYWDSIVTTFPAEFIVSPPAVAEFWRALAVGGRLVVVPAAAIMPAHVLDVLAKWLFEITGQSAPDTRWSEAFANVYQSGGFVVTVRLTKLRRSVVWVVIAEKTAPD